MKRSAQAGMTLAEVTIASAILAVSVLGLVAAMSADFKQSGVSDDSQIAIQALRRKVEEMRAADFSTFFTDWSGHTFTVAGLRENAAGVPHGSVTFLTERQARNYWTASTVPGGLVDLDGDGVLDETEAPVAGLKAYAVRVALTFGDKVENRDRTLDVTTVFFDPSGG